LTPWSTKRGCSDLVNAHDEYLSYSVTEHGKNYHLPSYLLILQRDITNWLKALEDAVNIVTPFNKNTDSEKGLMGIWINTYAVKDEGLNTLIKKMDKYHKKLMDYAVKINKEDESKGKTKQVNRSAEASARIEQYFGKIHKHIAPVYQTLDTAKTNKLKALADSVVSINKELETLIKGAEKEMSVNMDSVAAASEQASINISTVSIATDEINSSISEIAKNSEIGNSITQEAVKKVKSATQRINELGEAAKKISSIEVFKNSDLVNANSGELKKLAKDLQELVSQFKL